ncbi:MAG TPA: 1-phosphofructokinase [Candidatus Nanopelagicales bacterium]
MIVTVTLNPSLDRTLAVAALHRGEVMRATSTLEDPGGKGVNVTRFLTARGNRSLAVLPLGGSIGRAMVGALTDEGIPHRSVVIAGATRSNVTIVEPDGTTTKLNEPGPDLTPLEVDGILAAVAQAAVSGGWVVVAGSLPGDLDPAVVGELARVARMAGSRFALDTSGRALVDGVPDAKPDVIKPNDEELGSLVGREVTSLDDVLDACVEAQALGAGAVVCSLGADGALLVDGEGRWRATGPRVPVSSTVGAGDSLLAGFLHAGGSGPEALRVGVAWASAAVQTPGTGVPPPSLIRPLEVQVAPI